MRRLGRLLGYLRPYAAGVAGSLVLSFFVAGLTSLSLSTLIPILQTLFEEGGLQSFQQGVREWGGRVSPGAADAVVRALFPTRMAALASLIGLVFAMTVLKGVLRFAGEYLVGSVSLAAGRDLSDDLFGRLVRQPVLFVEREGVGNLASRFTADADQIIRGLKTLTGTLFREPLQFFFLLLLALLISPILTLAALVIFPLVGLLVRRVGRVARRSARGVLVHRSRLLVILQETFFGIRLVQSCRGEGRSAERFRRENRRLFDRTRDLVRVEAVTSPAMEVLVVLGVGGALLLGGAMAIRGEIDAPRLVTLYVAVGALYEPVRKVAAAFPRVTAGLAGAQRVFDYLDRVPEVRDAPDATPLGPLRQEVRLSGVTVTYGGTDRALDRVDLQVPAGSWLSVVGPSGSGKSTLASLLPRFFDPEEGAVLLDGRELRSATLESLRERVSLVTQEAVLLNESIRANISFSRPEAPETEVAEAARVAGVAEFLDRLPDGLDSTAGERGASLSGGQRQRVTIARALLARPDVLVLDEATSQMDEELAREVLAGIRRARQGLTTIQITHRVETLVGGERIAVLSRGRLEAIGSHEDLLAGSPTYRELLNAAAASRGERP